MKQQEKAKYLPKDKIKPFLDMVRKRDVYQYFLFRTLIETGMRIGEASALNWNDYDRKLKTLSITKSYNQKSNKFGPTKNKENRVIFISDELAKELFKLRIYKIVTKLLMRISIIILTIISSVMSLVNHYHVQQLIIL